MSMDSFGWQTGDFRTQFVRSAVTYLPATLWNYQIDADEMTDEGFGGYFDCDLHINAVGFVIQNANKEGVLEMIANLGGVEKCRDYPVAFCRFLGELYKFRNKMRHLPKIDFNAPTCALAETLAASDAIARLKQWYGKAVHMKQKNNGRFVTREETEKLKADVKARFERKRAEAWEKENGTKEREDLGYGGWS